MEGETSSEAWHTSKGLSRVPPQPDRLNEVGLGNALTSLADVSDEMEVSSGKKYSSAELSSSH